MASHVASTTSVILDSVARCVAMYGIKVFTYKDPSMSMTQIQLQVNQMIAISDESLYSSPDINEYKKMVIDKLLKAAKAELEEQLKVIEDDKNYWKQHAIDYNFEDVFYNKNQYKDYWWHTPAPKNDNGSEVLNFIKEKFDCAEKWVDMPEHYCHNNHCSGRQRLVNAIMHLNDQGWSREEIADWLETLDLDIRMKEDNGDTDMGLTINSHPNF